MKLSPAAAVAASICYLARSSGLPEVAELRRQVVQRHAMTCAWCDYDPADIVRLVREAWHDPVALARFGHLPPQEQRRQVDDAQEAES